ncbi:SPW repeat domain-containing protein [Autumnicola musiva]|uniref:SPW repeat protein n=1 Tax=Autumnicola musiva TaxID=3075589 RepID=A0ABU3D560_9FLAO|nr:SPW repeat protein [Zunongwangia sp. F117]MDT0676672.1 SPW repeat protein [Zunongwangia sp. F117]
MISTKLHGYLDYLMGIFLIVSPWIFNFPQGMATTLPIVLGAGTILYSLLTAYELGAFGLIPVPVHLIIDVLAGVLLIASPWIFGFSDQVYLPFVVLGAIEVLTGLMTSKKPLTPDLQRG